MQYEINKFVDVSYFLVCCSYYLTGQNLPKLFEEIILQFDNSMVGEEPYSLIEKLYQEATQCVAKSSISIKIIN